MYLGELKKYINKMAALVEKKIKMRWKSRIKDNCD
jgi:hypothetical protein